MKMDQVADSGNDEFYTPAYAIVPLLKHLRPNSKVWCPFDTEDSYFVHLLEHSGHRTYPTHLEGGHDFFDLVDKVNGADYIISNPPYSLKTEVLEELLRRDTPFAMLVGVVGLFESQRRFDLFRQSPFEIMYFNRRVAYLREYGEPPALNPPFSSVYVCAGVLPQPMCFEEVNKKIVHPGDYNVE